MGYVYKITNTVNNKSYIGISIHEPEKDRIQKHLSGHGNRIIANAVKKYGRDAFTYEVLEENVFDEFLPELEVAYIANYNTVAPNGYNLTSGGEVAKTLSAETRRKIGEAGKGRNHSIEARRKMSKARKGKTLSAEHRSKISEALKGKTRSEEHCRKLSEARKGEKHYFYGKTHSAETRRKIGEAQKGKKGKPHSAEARRKMSKARKGKTFSVEHRRKLSEARKGKKHSVETCSKISESKRGKTHSAEERRKMSEARKGEKNHRFGKPVSEETRRKISEANRLPEYASAHKFFFSLPPDIPLKEKRKLLYAEFPNVTKVRICKWVRKWVS